MTTLAIPTDAPKVLTGPPQGQWTLADWEEISDDGNRYEIIHGALYMSTAPSPLHQWVVVQIVRLVGIPAQERGLGFLYPSPIGVIMPGCDPVQPDIVFIRHERKAIIQDRRIVGVPDLIIEILSPGNRAYDEQIKLQAYATAGVPEYAIVDPESTTLMLYQLEAPGRYAGAVTFKGAQTVNLNCLSGVSFAVKDLFAGGPDATS